jgi:hypothetical protein
MKNYKILATLLVVLSVVTAPGYTAGVNTPAAATSDAAESPAIDPNLQFYVALSACTAGSYAERNILSGTIGQSTMQQQIIGPNQDTCSATLITPDNRTLNCEFPLTSLSLLADQHFLQGMLVDNLNNPDQASLNADLAWSKLKLDSCSFVN